MPWWMEPQAGYGIQVTGTYLPLFFSRKSTSSLRVSVSSFMESHPHHQPRFGCPRFPQLVLLLSPTFGSVSDLGQGKQCLNSFCVPIQWSSELNCFLLHQLYQPLMSQIVLPSKSDPTYSSHCGPMGPCFYPLPLHPLHSRIDSSNSVLNAQIQPLWTPPLLHASTLVLISKILQKSKSLMSQEVRQA